MMYWYGTGVGGGWGYALMTVNMLLFWGVIVGGVVALVRYLSWSGRTHHIDPMGPQTPERILAQRFARGDIDEEEYRRRVAVVRGFPTS